MEFTDDAARYRLLRESKMSSPTSLKRSYADAGLDGHQQDQIAPIPSAFKQVPTFGQTFSRSQSPAGLPIPTSSAACDTSTLAGPGSPAATTPNKSNKRNKRPIAEKEEEKARKDEQKRIRDAEKEERKKVREDQAKAREAEKQRKLDERQKAEEEKNKKARSQLRLNAFFVQPSMPSVTPSSSPTRDIASPLGSRRSSIADIRTMEAPRERSRSVSVTPQKARLPDYERQFPPFFLQSHTVLAPHSRFSRDDKGLEYAQTKIDQGLNQGLGAVGPFNAYDMLHLSPDSRRRFPRVHAVKDIIAKIHGSVANPIDLTESQSRKAIQKPAHLLKTVPMKYLKFDEDYRPPYSGTFTKPLDRRARSKLCRNPFSRELPKTDYDYDSEPEWEEPGEGEDLDSEGEEDVGEDEEENDMDGFVDDDESGAVKKRPLLGDLEPACTGICWEGLESERSKPENLDILDLSLFKLDILMDNPRLPIDPYSTSYWQTTATANPLHAPPMVHGMLMEPPRIPLNPINRQNTLLSPSTAVNGTKIATSNATAPMKAPKGPIRLIPSELIEEFKKAVDGNELTKLGLLEVLKKQFPKQPKPALRDTLDKFAERVGAKEAEKKWVLKDVSQS